MQGIVTYLHFDGSCKEAMEFYSKALGGNLQMTPFSQIPGEAPANVKSAPERIMHAQITKGPVPLLMASDCPPGTPYQLGDNFSVSVGCESKEEIQSLFKALGDGGTVTMPLADQFWGAHFGMLKDKFGIEWMLNYEYPKK